MSARSERLKRVPVPRRIMLLLHDHQKHLDSYEVPEIVSQYGIVNELGLRQNHVSRALTELLSAGLIQSRSSHVKGIARRRRVYFLSQKGTDEMTSFLDELSKKSVMVRKSEGQILEYSLAKVRKELGIRLEYVPSYHKILTYYLDGNEINLMKPGELTKTGIKGPQKLNIPQERHFYGREKELQSVNEMVLGGRYRFLVINSMAGQGKTAFLVNLVNNIKDRPVVWSTLSEWTMPSNLLNDWGYFLKEHGRSKLFDHLGTASPLETFEALKVFLQDSRSLGPLVVLDDFHKARDDVVTMLQQLKAQVGDGDSTVFLIASRQRPKFYKQKDLVVSKKVHEVSLDGLDFQSSALILKDKDIPETEFSKAFEVTKGHPLALELYHPAFVPGEEQTSLEFDTFVGEEMIQSLSGQEKDVLKLASVFSNPVPARAFFFNKDIDQDVLDVLCNRFIMRSYQNSTYDVHDIIKSYFDHRMNDHERMDFLSIACDHYSNCSSERDLLEHIRLLAQSDRKDEFMTTLLENGEYLLSQGYAQIGEYVNEIDDDEVEGLDRVRVLILKSDSALVGGGIPKARLLLKRGLDISDGLLKSSDKSILKDELIQQISRIYNLNAEISKSEGKMDETIATHRKSVMLNRKYSNKPGEGKALNNLAIAYRERGDLNLALETLQKAQEVFQGLGDENALALVLVNMGDVHFLRRDYRFATKYFNEAKEISPRYPSVRGPMYRRIGRAQLGMGKYKAANEKLTESLDAFKEANDMNNQCLVLNDLFESAIGLRSKELAKGYLLTCEKLLEMNLKEKKDSKVLKEHFDSHLKNHLLYAATWSKNDVDKRIKKISDFQIKSSSPRAILKYLEEVAEDLKRYPNVILKLYSSMEEGLSKLGDKHPLVILSIRRVELLVEMKRKQEARSLSKRILPVVKKMGFKKAVKRLEKIIG